VKICVCRHRFGSELLASDVRISKLNRTPNAAESTGDALNHPAVHLDLTRDKRRQDFKGNMAFLKACKIKPNSMISLTAATMHENCQAIARSVRPVSAAIKVGWAGGVAEKGSAGSQTRCSFFALHATPRAACSDTALASRWDTGDEASYSSAVGNLSNLPAVGPARPIRAVCVGGRSEPSPRQQTSDWTGPPRQAEAMAEPSAHESLRVG